MPRPFDPEVVLNQPLVANLATVEADGSPRNAPVWFLWEGGSLFMLSDRASSSFRRISHDSRIAVEIVHFDRERGILLHLGMRGHATLEPMDDDLFRRLLRRYLGPDETTWNPWFIDRVAQIDDPDGRLIVLRPDGIFTNNVSYFRTGPDLAFP